jgi:hypothetical protein
VVPSREGKARALEIDGRAEACVGEKSPVSVVVHPAKLALDMIQRQT